MKMKKRKKKALTQAVSLPALTAQAAKERRAAEERDKPPERETLSARGKSRKDRRGLSPEAVKPLTFSERQKKQEGSSTSSGNTYVSPYMYDP